MPNLTIHRIVNYAIREKVKNLFKSYDLFFQMLREGKYQDFTSVLEADLDKE